MLAAALPLQYAARAESPPKRPSILWVIPDQMRAQALGCMGNPDVKTPNLDRLASEGVLFRKTFANTPVCCPARAILLTGKYPNKNGMMANDLHLRESETSLAEILSDAGYRTGFIGKWHLEGGPRNPGFVPPGPKRQGFDFWAAHECQHSHFRPVYFRDTPEPIVDQRFEPEVWTDLALEFLDGLDPDQPYFLAVEMGPPHDPYGAPEPYRSMYQPNEITLRPNWEPGVPNAGKEQIATYYAAITAIDAQVGRLMEGLKARKQDQNTIVLVTSDHGDMLGSHGQRLKRKPWEESIRVPGILRYPAKVKPGRVSDALVSHVDIAPTMLALCGLPVPRSMQGTDLSRLVLGETEQGPDSVFFQIFVPYDGDGTSGAWRGVRTNHHMYARSSEGPWLLYDLENDPYEQKNLIGDPTSQALQKRLDARLSRWMEQVGDSWSLNSDAHVEDEGRLYRFRSFTTIEEYLEWAREHPDLAPPDSPGKARPSGVDD
ncbi:MAG TPA: sulfatase [Isosphaeraceae bacterium]|nr:sulfatase [Isosphaeraceae bacterium]